MLQRASRLWRSAVACQRGELWLIPSSEETVLISLTLTASGGQKLTVSLFKIYRQYLFITYHDCTGKAPELHARSNIDSVIHICTHSSYTTEPQYCWEICSLILMEFTGCSRYDKGEIPSCTSSLLLSAHKYLVTKETEGKNIPSDSFVVSILPVRLSDHQWIVLFNVCGCDPIRKSHVYLWPFHHG